MSSDRSKDGYVRPGSFCPLGASGTTAPGKDGRPGTPMECVSAGEGRRARWRKAAGAVSASRVRKRAPRTTQQRAADKLRTSEVGFLRQAAGLAHDGPLPRRSSQYDKLNKAGFIDDNREITAAGRDALRHLGHLMPVPAPDGTPAPPATPEAYARDRSDWAGIDWSKYGDCPTCRPGAGRPCIDQRNRNDYLAHPHPGRPLLEHAVPASAAPAPVPPAPGSTPAPADTAAIAAELLAMRDRIRTTPDHGVTRDSARALLTGLTTAQLRDVADRIGAPAAHLRNKADLQHHIVQNAVGFVLASHAMNPRRKAPTEAAAPLDDRIKSAYNDLATRPNGPVSLADLRDRLADVPREDLDKALRDMDDRRESQLEPDPDRAGLTQRDKDGALPLWDGGTQTHLIRMRDQADTPTPTPVSTPVDRSADAGVDWSEYDDCADCSATTGQACYDLSRPGTGSRNSTPHPGRRKVASRWSDWLRDQSDVEPPAQVPMDEYDTPPTPAEVAAHRGRCGADIFGSPHTFVDDPVMSARRDVETCGQPADAFIHGTPDPYDVDRDTQPAPPARDWTAGLPDRAPATVARRLQEMRDHIPITPDHGVTVDQARHLLDGLTVAQLHDVAGDLGVPAGHLRNKADLQHHIVQNSVGHRLTSYALNPRWKTSASTPVDRSADAGVDWSRYRSCGDCGAGPGAPCLDLRGDGSYNATPHPGRATFGQAPAVPAPAGSVSQVPWWKYGACPICGAFTASPCTGDLGGAAAAPHPGRPVVAADEPGEDTTGQDLQARRVQAAADVHDVLKDMSNNPRYDRLSDKWMALSRVRPAIRDRFGGKYSRAEVDQALRDLTDRDVLTLEPEANQKTLRDEDRSATLRMGGEDRHLVALEPDRPTVDELNSRRVVAVLTENNATGGDSSMDMVDVRARAGLTPAEFDRAVAHLARTRQVRAEPEVHRHRLDDARRDAAVTIGGEPRHWLSTAGEEEQR